MKKTKRTVEAKEQEVTLIVDGQTAFNTTETPNKKLVYVTIESIDNEHEQVQISAMQVIIKHLDSAFGGIAQAYIQSLMSELIEHGTPEPIAKFLTVKKLSESLSGAFESVLDSPDSDSSDKH